MGYLHFEIKDCQSSKKPGTPCGDVCGYERNISSTVSVLSDGLGSGIKANIAANMTVARILEMIKKGLSQRAVFSSLVKTMNSNWGTEQPFAVFSILKVLNNGETSLLSYEMPEPVFVGRKNAYVLKGRNFAIDKAVISENNCFIESGEGILLFSDGVSQSGIGCGLATGWGSEGVAGYVTDLLQEGAQPSETIEYVHDRALEIWGKKRGDDITVSGIFCRPGNCVTVFSGPPLSERNDAATVRKFLLSEGVKVVCGATTAKIVSRHCGRKLFVEQDSESSITPPSYKINGIDFVTEGAVTLNQICNLIDEPERLVPTDTIVGKLVNLLNNADRITFICGASPNPASGDISFRQQGILSRDKIITILVAALRKKRKLVTVEHI